MPGFSPLLTESLIYHLSVKDGLSFNHGLAPTQMPAGASISCKREVEEYALSGRVPAVVISKTGLFNRIHSSLTTFSVN